jgi:hypothetical protein
MKTTVTLLLSAIAAGALGIGFAAALDVRSDRLQPVKGPAEAGHYELPAATHRSGVAAQPAKSKVSKFMRAKLEAAQNVLDGLVTEDYGKIEKGAEKMIVMSKAADWQVIQGPTYAQYSSEFRRAAERLVKRAKAKQLDSAALSYMHVTMTCINCHKYVKNAKVARGEPLSPGLKYALELDNTRSHLSRQKDW